MAEPTVSGTSAANSPTPQPAGGTPAGATLEAVEPAQARSVYIRTYGCQMNASDSELVCAILSSAGYRLTENEREADVVLLNTCAIRDKAEARIWGKLQLLKHQRQEHARSARAAGASADAGPGHRVVGLLGCMAERLKDKLLDSGMVHVIAGAITCCTRLSRCRLSS